MMPDTSVSLGFSVMLFEAFSCILIFVDCCLKLDVIREFVLFVWRQVHIIFSEAV